MGSGNQLAANAGRRVCTKGVMEADNSSLVACSASKLRSAGFWLADTVGTPVSYTHLSYWILK